MPRLRLLFFASAREIAGVSEAVCDLPEGSAEGESVTTESVRAYLASEFPGLADQAETVTLAVNQEYVEAGAHVPVRDGDEVAVIPPISGG
mmetsp:Transcript_12566/g.36425  ORF Transcript_12566/g.36425 Transcript_12566/m.36425 type:complete len:91 (-) Transcript_12566:687-959(-)